MTYKTNSQIKHKTSILKSSLCDNIDAYVLVNWTITVVGARAADAARIPGRNNKQEIFKDRAPLTDYITELNNTQVNNTKDLDVVMPMYNLIEYSNNYSKASVSLCQFCRDEPNNNITILNHLDLNKNS